MSLKATNVFFGYGPRQIFSDISLEVGHGLLTMLVGANGSGKTTLLHVLGGRLKPRAGEVRTDGRSVYRMQDLTRARKISVMAQTPPPALDFTVRERIMMGRFARLPRILPPSSMDERRVDLLLELMGLERLANVPCNQLSGGEYQRTLIAATMSCRSDYLLLDEPTSNLDPAWAMRACRAFKELPESPGVFFVTHDLGLACNFADVVMLLHQGRILASGTPAEVLTEENVTTVYGCPSKVLPVGDRRAVVFY